MFWGNDFANFINVSDEPIVENSLSRYFLFNNCNNNNNSYNSDDL